MGRACCSARRSREARRHPARIFLGLLTVLRFSDGHFGHVRREADPARRRRRDRAARHASVQGTCRRNNSRHRHGQIDGYLHQRHGFCANCGHPHGDEGRRLEARVPELQVPSISRTDPVVIMLVTHGENACSAGRAVHARDVVGLPACRSGGDHRRRRPREIFEESGSAAPT